MRGHFRIWRRSEPASGARSPQARLCIIRHKRRSSSSSSDVADSNVRALVRANANELCLAITGADASRAADERDWRAAAVARSGAAAGHRLWHWHWHWRCRADDARLAALLPDRVDHRLWAARVAFALGGHLSSRHAQYACVAARDGDDVRAWSLSDPNERRVHHPGRPLLWRLRRRPRLHWSAQSPGAHVDGVQDPGGAHQRF